MKEALGGCTKESFLARIKYHCHLYLSLSCKKKRVKGLQSLIILCFHLIQVVAVKQLDRNGFQGNREFLVEVLMLSLLHHPNLVNLVGYCADGDQRILAYEYMPNGSLEDHLLGIPQITQFASFIKALNQTGELDKYK